MKVRPMTYEVPFIIPIWKMISKQSSCAPTMEKKRQVRAALLDTFIPPLTDIIVAYLPLRETFVREVALPERVREFTVYKGKYYIVSEFPSFLYILNEEGKLLDKYRLDRWCICVNIAVDDHAVYIVDVYDNAVHILREGRSTQWRMRSCHSIALREDAMIIGAYDPPGLSIYARDRKFIQHIPCKHPVSQIALTSTHMHTIGKKDSPVTMFTKAGELVKEYLPKFYISIASSAQDEIYLLTCNDEVPLAPENKNIGDVFVCSSTGEQLRAVHKENWFPHRLHVHDNRLYVSDGRKKALYVFNIDIDIE